MKIYKLSVLIIFLGLLNLSFLSACSRQDESSAETAKQPEKVVPVTVEQITLSDLVETFTLPAHLEAWEDLTLAAEIAGAVQKIHYREGAQVRAGATLLEIDPDTIKSYLQRDRQNVTVIERKLERFRQLEADGLVSQQELDDLENGLTAARSALKTTELQLAKSLPRAPVSGVVDYLYVDRGEYVDPGKPLLRLVQVDKLKVVADVPEKDVPFLKIGQKVEIIPAAMSHLSSDSMVGIIDYIALSANTTTRTYRTKIILDNSSAKLRPGMIVRAKFVRQSLDQVISVPLFAVIDRDGEKVIFLAEDGRARQVKIMTGSSIGQRIVVRQGLIENQSLIVEGQQLLIDGAKIEVGEH
ncbi:MAG: efflux RND transporter periplasmic adaptor subunit [Thermodesulfobacteriota bacterium]|nr:efflux RND transporter periplasmic adaptor subunit [Thermodesulfobacteriota bacterium]